MMRRQRALIPCLLVMAALACSDGAAGGPAADPVYTIAVSGDGVSDTILARLPTLLTATVTEHGRPARGVWVRFRPIGCSYPECVGLAPINSEAYADDELASRTDADGRFRVKVQFSYLSGTRTVLAELADSSAADTAVYEVRPGNPSQVFVLGADSTVVIGSSYTPDVQVADEGGNLLPLPFTVTSSSPSVAQVVGTAVKGVTFGRADLTFRVSAGSWTGEATGSATVVPPGKLALSEYQALALANTDGSGHRQIFSWGGVAAWSPDGQALAVHSVFLVGLPLMGQDGHTIRALLPVPNTSSWSADLPSFSRDGAWVYFGGGVEYAGPAAIWRVHPDASGLEQVTGVGAPSDGADASPSPSPDGSRIVYSTTHGGTERRLVIKELATGAVTELGLFGAYPSWSPTGDQIAFWRDVEYPDVDRLFLVSASGGTPVEIPLTGTTPYATQGASWSPDGQWLAFTATTPLGAVAFVRTSDNLLLSLPWTKGGVVGWAAGTVP